MDLAKVQQWVQDNVIVASADCVTDKSVFWENYRLVNNSTKYRDVFFSLLGTALTKADIFKTGQIEAVKVRKRCRGYRGITVKDLNLKCDTKQATYESLEEEAKLKAVDRHNLRKSYENEGESFDKIRNLQSGIEWREDPFPADFFDDKFL